MEDIKIGEILVWYERGKLTGSMHLTLSDDKNARFNRIEDAMLDYEQRNPDTIITQMQDPFTHEIFDVRIRRPNCRWATKGPIALGSYTPDNTPTIQRYVKNWKPRND